MASQVVMLVVMRIKSIKKIYIFIIQNKKCTRTKNDKTETPQYLGLQ